MNAPPNAIVVHTPEYIAERLKLLIVNGRRFTNEEALALAQYAVATDLNPFVGECFFIPGVGPAPGIAGWRKKADEQLEYEARRAAEPLARFWAYYLEPAEGEVGKLNPGDIAVKAVLHDTLTKTAWERRILSYYLELVKSGVKDWDAARDLAGPEPIWSAIGVVRAGENFGANEKMDRYERACKRAEKAAIRKRFPRVHLPEPEGFDGDVVDSVAYDVPAEPSSSTTLSIPAENSPAAAQEKSIPTTPPGNGKHKIERPLSPADLKSFLEKKAALHGSRAASEKQIGLCASVLELCFAGQEHSDKIRHSVLDYLTGQNSLKHVPGTMVIALLDWLKPTQDSGNAYTPDPMAMREAQAVWSESLRAAGQMEIPLTPEAPQAISDIVDTS